MENKKNQNKISVIIPIHNASLTIKHCLDSIANQNYPNFDIIAVNDGSTDDTLEKLSHYTLKVFSNQKSKGAAFSRNRGAMNTDAEVVLFVDSDVVIPPNALSRISETFDATSDICGIGAVFSDKTAHLNFVSDYKNLELSYRSNLRPPYAQYLGSHFLAVKRKLFLENGGFPTEFPGSSVEDIALGYRLTKGKKTMFIDRGVAVDHLKRYSLLTMLKTDFNRIFNMVKIIKNSHGKHKAGEEASLKSFINLILPAVLFTTIVLGIMSNTWWPSLIIGFLFVVTNFGFLNFLFRRRGALFTVCGLLLFFVEYFFVTLSIGVSSIVFLLKRK